MEERYMKFLQLETKAWFVTYTDSWGSQAVYYFCSQPEAFERLLWCYENKCDDAVMGYDKRLDKKQG